MSLDYSKLLAKVYHNDKIVGMVFDTSADKFIFTPKEICIQWTHSDGSYSYEFFPGMIPVSAHKAWQRSGLTYRSLH
jgi:hypothetical protein